MTQHDEHYRVAGQRRAAPGMLRSAMGYLAAADATQMAAETQAQCLLALEQLDAIEAEAVLDDHLSTLFG